MTATAYFPSHIGQTGAGGHISPSLDAVRALATTEQEGSPSREGSHGNRVPVYRELVGDLETPVTAYLKLARGGYGFLLESVEGGERVGRYSFLGTAPTTVLTLHNGTITAIHADGTRETATFTDPLEALGRYLAPHRPVSLPGVELPTFFGGAVGYLGYESVRYFEPRVPLAATDPLGLPDAVFMLTDTMLIFDHFRRKLLAVTYVPTDAGDLAAAYNDAARRLDDLAVRLRAPVPPQPAPNREGSTPTANMTQADYEAAVRRAKEYIAAGDAIQVVPSQRLAVPLATTPFTVYRALRAVNPSPYMVYFDLGDMQVVASSPESLVACHDGVITTHPIAGTRPRGATPAEDADLEREMAGDEKERAEHIMLVDLGRNDIGRIAEPGSVTVPILMKVERYSHVMHLESEVAGRLKPEYTALDALRACFPMGTATGAPKIRAMQIIAELEHEQRGVYAGALGYVGYDGGMDFALALRTMPVKNGIAYPQAGAGVVADSDPESEHRECFQKMGALLRAIETANAM